jgi:signal peptidase I
MKKRTIVLLASVVVALVVATGVALVVLRALFFVPFKQPSSSMLPSLPVNGIIFVNRTNKTPEYGVVMVFHYPENPAQDFDKRIVGLPGDEIEMHGTTVVINGWEAPHCRVGRWMYDDEDTLPPHHEGNLDLEWLGDETYLVFHDDGKDQLFNGPFTVKSGEYFVMGDNRENSHDSRGWFGGMGGGVPNDHTVGRVRMGKLALPRGAESLRPALDACLAKKPAKTTPPPSHP